MELIFLLIAIITTMIFVYVVGRSVYSHKELMDAYKSSEDLRGIHLFAGLVLILVIFITLCAFNNTFWCLPYLNN